ncbi:MAG: 16S rRNA (uracil(1498)-N(3))-methyltransferase [Coriobacteriia bacterium]|nr:16S rRNA (uracil(1498)-N(3))-methyltransferase [Coriobacteriia bacterium]
MSRHRFFLIEAVPAVSDGGVVRIPLSESDRHHAVDVLRVRVGEEIDVVDPAGSVLRVRVDSALGGEVLGVVVGEAQPDPEVRTPRVTLVFGVSKGSKNDEIVEAVCELGVEVVVPVLTARSVVKYDAEKRADRGERWRRIALAAAKQSKRTTIPTVLDPLSLGGAGDLFAGYDAVLVAWEDAGSTAQGAREALASFDSLPADARVCVVVGPEGGFAAEEVDRLVAGGARIFTLGPTVLRVATAATVAVAIVTHELGGLGNVR